jgi:DNA-binding MarR family transcriptional regulator
VSCLTPSRKAPEILVSARKPPQFPPEPPRAVAAALRERFSAREQQMLETVFAVRSTAQQMDNTISEWMADSAATPARFQILTQLWAAKRRGVPQKDIATAMGVTRATVSGLMAVLERDGLVTSTMASDDRRSYLASLTRKGDAVVEKAIESNKARLRAALTTLTPDELTTLTTLLERFRQGFSVSPDGTGRRARKL